MRDERRDVFRVHLPAGGGGGGEEEEEEEERICLSGERKEVASIKEEVSSQSDVRKQLQERGDAEGYGQEKDLQRTIPFCKLKLISKYILQVQKLHQKS